MKTYTVIYEVDVEIDNETINGFTDPDSSEDDIENFVYSEAWDLLMDGVYCDTIRS